QDLQGRGYVLRAVGICAPGGPESEWQDQDPPPRGDPAPPRRQRGHGPGEGQGIGIVARNRSAALRTPEGRSMKTSRLGPTPGPSVTPTVTPQETERTYSWPRCVSPRSLAPAGPRARRAPDPRPGTRVRAGQGPDLRPLP